MLKQTRSGVTPRLIIRDQSQGSSSTCSSTATLHHCLAMRSPSEALRGGTMGNRTTDLREHGHFDAPFVSTNHRSVNSVSWDMLVLPVTQYWDIHAMSDITGTKKLKSFSPLRKSNWDPSTKLLQNHSYLKLGISSSSDALSSLSFPIFSSVKWM